MSFFEEKEAFMEIDIPKQKLSILRHRLAKGAKLAVKLEIKNKQVELKIIDEAVQIFKLIGFQNKTESNLLLLRDEMKQKDEAIGLVEYKCKTMKEDSESEVEDLKYKFSYLSNENERDRVEEIDEDEENDFFKQDKLSLPHKEFQKKNESITKFKDINKDDQEDIKLNLYKYIYSLPEGTGASISELQKLKQFNFIKVGQFISLKNYIYRTPQETYQLKFPMLKKGKQRMKINTL